MDKKLHRISYIFAAVASICFIGGLVVLSN